MGRQILYSLLIIYVGTTVCGAGISGFVQTRGNQFILNGKTFDFNGFNAYWMMVVASGVTNQSGSVGSVLHQASQNGLTVGRAWAFSDGGPFALQTSPGIYDESMFKGLDSVIAQAGRNGIRLILSLVNNYPDFGGRKQYVQWARERGQSISSEDDFYRNNLVKSYYKNHIKTVIMRTNTITRVAYKDDPTIFAWELINEPRCQSDLSGQTFQSWVGEMASFVKSIDRSHLVEIGSEGFYGQSMPQRKRANPFNSLYGTDFITNNQVPGIDFASIHAYPDIWLSGSSDQNQLNYMYSWIQTHIRDTVRLLKKPLTITEFGKSSCGSEVAKRDEFFWKAYDSIYLSAKAGGPLCGGLFWQIMDRGMDNFRDGYGIVLAGSPSTANVVFQQSQRISKLNYMWDDSKKFPQAG